MLTKIAEIDDPNLARVLVTALKAHGFHPMEGGEAGLPGMPGVMPPKGIAVLMPEGEAADAKLLADDLLAQMRKGTV